MIVLNITNNYNITVYTQLQINTFTVVIASYTQELYSKLVSWFQQDDNSTSGIQQW